MFIQYIAHSDESSWDKNMTVVIPSAIISMGPLKKTLESFPHKSQWQALRRETARVAQKR